MKKEKIFLVLLPVAVSILPLSAQPTLEERYRENTRQAVVDDMERAERAKNGYNQGYGMVDLFFDMVDAYAEYLQEQQIKAEFNKMIREINSNALDLHRNGLSETAIKKIDAAYEEYPEQFTLLFTKGTILYDLRKNDEAEHCFHSVLAKYPDHAQAYIYLGLIASNRGDEGAACYNFDKACKVNSSAHEAFFFRGLCRKNKGDYYDAIRDFSRVLELVPNYRAAFYQRALCHYQMENLTSARINLNQAIRYYPKDAELYNLRGMVYYREDNLDKALEDFDKALALQPGLVEASFNRSGVLLSQKKFHMAKEEVKRAIRLDSENGGLYYVLAIINDRLEEPENACLNRKKACELNYKEACEWELPGCK